MADIAASIVGAAIYGVLNTVTSIAGLVAFSQSVHWTKSSCKFNASEIFNETYPVRDIWHADPCDYNRWMIYLWATLAAALGTYVAFLVVFRHNKSDASNWRPVTQGISFSLFLWLLVYYVGWAPSWPGSPTGYFSRDLEADGMNWIAIMLRDRDAVIPMFPALAAAKATIWLAHITGTVGAFLVATGYACQGQEVEEKIM